MLSLIQLASSSQNVQLNDSIQTVFLNRDHHYDSQWDQLLGFMNLIYSEH